MLIILKKVNYSSLPFWCINSLMNDAVIIPDGKAIIAIPKNEEIILTILPKKVTG